MTRERDPVYWVLEGAHKDSVYNTTSCFTFRQVKSCRIGKNPMERDPHNNPLGSLN